MDEHEEIAAPAPEATTVAPARKPRKSAKKRKEAKVAKQKTARKAKGKKDQIVRGALTLGKTYHRGESNAGNVSYDSGDKVAQDLRGMALEDVYELAAKKLGEPVRSLKAKYGKLNAGMQRMNLGNRLRKAIRDKVAQKKAA